MPDYEQTATIDTEPDDLFDYLGEPQHMPEFLPVSDEADIYGDQAIFEVETADGVERTDGWIHVDALEHRMEWGSHDGTYHGWLQVDPGDLRGSLVTIHAYSDQQADVDDELAQALENIRRHATA